MPNKKSAEKALRQSDRRKRKNTARKIRYKVSVKEFRKLISEEKFEEAKKILPMVYKKLDKATKGKTIKKNKASRLKANATRLLAKSTKK
jgi:small subunit ribosomal protein S20